MGNAAERLLAKADKLMTKASLSVTEAQNLRKEANVSIAEAANIEHLSASDTAMADNTIANFEKALIASITELCEKHQVDVSFGELKQSTKRGIMNLGIRMCTKAYNENRESNKYFRKTGQTQAEMRFEKHFHEVGLEESNLHQRFNIGGTQMELLGLKGRQHKVLLRPVGKSDNTSDVQLLSPEFFKLTGKKVLKAS